MARKKFDASLKDIVDVRPADWARLLGTAAPIRSVRVIDAEVSTVSAAADKAMLVDDGGPEEWVLHPEFVSGRDLALPGNVWWYSSVLHRRHGRLVRSVVLLLRPAADGPEVDAGYVLRFRDEPGPYNTFLYRVVRLWRMPVEQLLGGGIGTLPLAPLTDDAAAAVPEVVARIERRLVAEATEQEANKLRAATAVLMGLRHPPDLIRQVLEGVMNMSWDKVYEDSSIVQEAVRQAESRAEARGEARGQVLGAIAHARRLLLRQGEAKFGPPDEASRSAVAGLSDLDRLDALGERLLRVNSWAELLSQA